MSRPIFKIATDVVLRGPVGSIPTRSRQPPETPVAGRKPGAHHGTGAAGRGVYATFHNPQSGPNVIPTDNSDWATNCPEYKVTAVQGDAGLPLLDVATSIQGFSELQQELPRWPGVRPGEGARSHNNTQNLVHMANQIGQFYEALPNREAGLASLTPSVMT